jgi:hypothetical protein
MTPEKFDVKPGDFVASQCILCKHRPDGLVGVCAAFPGRIPDTIRVNVHDHRTPWIDPESGEPGDQGIALAGSILFEPRPDAPREALERLARHFARPKP